MNQESHINIILLIPYFGKLPSYFPLWLLSAGYNPMVDFLILTDIRESFNLPKNVRIELLKWQDLQEKVKDVCGEDAVIHEPYKLCDYRPAYGRIFSQYIAGYDFWGHCDLDMILGNIRGFLPEEILASYERILTRGHFCLYRNTEDNNGRYLRTKEFEGINYADAFHTRYSCHFDEGRTIQTVFSIEEKTTYDNVCFADVLYNHFSFRLAQEIKGKDSPQVFCWKDGRLKRFYLEGNQIFVDEFMYLHLQKRKMQVCVTTPQEGYLVVPNCFLEIEDITSEFLIKNSKESLQYIARYYRNRLRSIMKNIMNGALKFRINGKAKK